LYDKSSCEGPLARLLLQCELIVEIYGLQQERLKVLPICFGVEGDGAGGGRVFSDVDAEALWPANPLSFSVKSIADRAKMLLRADGLQLAQGLNKSNLRIRSRNVASLMSGRHIKETLLVLKEFTKKKLFGCKHTEGERVSQEIIKLLDFSKRTRESDELEDGPASKMLRVHKHEGGATDLGKRDERADHYEGEGSSSDAKKPKQNSTSASTSGWSGGTVTPAGAGTGHGVAGAIPTDSHKVRFDTFDALRHERTHTRTSMHTYIYVHSFAHNPQLPSSLLKQKQSWIKCAHARIHTHTTHTCTTCRRKGPILSYSRCAWRTYQDLRATR
jgi:hypothetical protein